MVSLCLTFSPDRARRVVGDEVSLGRTEHARLGAEVVVLGVRARSSWGCTGVRVRGERPAAVRSGGGELALAWWRCVHAVLADGVGGALPRRVWRAKLV